MKNMTWTRIGLSAGVLSLASAGIFVACTGDDEGNRSRPPGTDSGVDAPATDAAADATPDAPVAKNATLAVVHAVANLGPVHACYALGGAVVGDSQNSNRPLGPLLPGIVSLQVAPVDFSKIPFTIFILDTTAPKVQAKIAAGTACPQLVSMAAGDAGDAGSDLVDGVDYFRLPSIPAGTLLQNKTFLIAVAGCTVKGGFGGEATGGKAADPAFCGAFDASAPTGNLQAVVRELSSASPGASSSGVQFAHLSTEANAAGLSPFVFIKNAAATDGGADSFQSVGSAPVPYLSVLPGSPAVVTNLTQASAVRLGPSPDAATAFPDPLPPFIDVPNVATQKASAQADAGAGYWANGSNYSYVVTGGLTGGTYNPFPDAGFANNHALHLLVVKTTP